MWMVLLAKYWKESILLSAILLLGTAFAVDELLDGRKIKALEKMSYECNVDLTRTEKNLSDLREKVDQQNAMVEQWKKTAENRAEALEDALSRPPEIIYRDRIVEVPSIVTGPCEEVVTDIADYVREIIHD